MISLEEASTKSYGVTIQMNSRQQYFHMVLPYFLK